MCFRTTFDKSYHYHTILERHTYNYICKGNFIVEHTAAVVCAIILNAIRMQLSGPKHSASFEFYSYP